MSNTIKITEKLEFITPSSTSFISTDGATSITQVITSGALKEGGEQSVGTSSELLDVGDLTYPCYLILRNRDATNYVALSTDNANAVDFSKLLPAGVPNIIFAMSPIYLKANTAACVVEWLAVKA